MIYSIGVTGLLMAFFHLEEKPLAQARCYSKRDDSTRRGRTCFLTIEEASEAAAVMNDGWLRDNQRQEIGNYQRWMVIGIEGDFNADTFHESPDVRFPNARELKTPRPMVELQQNLNL